MNTFPQTEQEIFDAVTNTLRVQGQKSVTPYGTCRYRGDNGCKCAVGHFVSDDEYTYEMEGYVISDSEIFKDFTQLEKFKKHQHLWSRLQKIHDLSVVDAWEAEWERLATERGLRYTPI